MEANRSWSIDDRRLNFQFGCQIGWEIRNGKRGRMLKNPTYAGVTPQFWNSCDAIGDGASWFAWGTPNCGKGEPIQSGRTTQAAAPARFRKSRSESAMTPDERGAIAEAVLARSRADATEVSVESSRLGLTRFTHESVNQNIDQTNTSVRVRAIVDGRIGIAATNALDDAALDDGRCARDRDRAPRAA